MQGLFALGDSTEKHENADRCPIDSTFGRARKFDIFTFERERSSKQEKTRNVSRLGQGSNDGRISFAEMLGCM